MSLAVTTVTFSSDVSQVPLGLVDGGPGPPPSVWPDGIVAGVGDPTISCDSPTSRMPHFFDGDWFDPW